MELTIDEALRKGVAEHKKGESQEAERFYRAILATQPSHPDANHNLGLLAISANKVSDAIPLFLAALQANSKVSQFWQSYISALIKLDQFENARQAIENAKNNGVPADHFKVFESLLISPPGNNKQTEPPQIRISALMQVFQSELYVEAERLALALTQEFPDHQFGWKVLGALFQKTNRTRNALNANKVAVELVPEDGEAHNNMGVTLRELGKLKEAEKSFRQAVTLKPKYVEALSNLGITLKELGLFEEAESSLRRALALAPDFIEAHSNLGVTLKAQGRLEEAFICFTRANEAGSISISVAENLVALMSVYEHSSDIADPVVELSEKIRNLDFDFQKAEEISDECAMAILFDSSQTLKNHSIILSTSLSQIYRSNSVDLNCKRHMSVFRSHGIIPEFCFGCYKVQVEPRTVLELIKLFLIFDQLTIEENNTRKCMVELRPEIPGFYKGLIYCSSLEVATRIARKVDVVVKKKTGTCLKVIVKRGCSEYPIKFPDYEDINYSGPQLMNYDENWRVIEERHDSESYFMADKSIGSSLRGLNLQDALIIQKWIDYAKGVGDPSVAFLEQEEVTYTDVYSLAKSRLDSFSFSDKLPANSI